MFFKSKEETKTNIEDMLINGESINAVASGATNTITLTNKRVIITHLGIKENTETITSIPIRNIISIELVKVKAKLTNVGDILRISTHNSNIDINVANPYKIYNAILDNIC